jgi:hypothetical protein
MARKTKEDWGREILEVRNRTLWVMFVICVVMSSASRCSGYNQGYQAGQKSVQQDIDSVRAAIKAQYMQKQDSIIKYQNTLQR